MELKKYRLVVSDEIKIDVFVSLVKEKMVESKTALSPKGRTPSKKIKAKD